MKNFLIIGSHRPKVRLSTTLRPIGPRIEPSVFQSAGLTVHPGATVHEFADSPYR
jgi:hypothetical protein